MGWFSNPKCPHCGTELQETGSCFPYPPWRCPTCIRVNKEKKAEQQEIANLKIRIAKLEKQNDGKNIV